MNHFIIITEYPKSGGSWLTTLIGDALHIPKRDIYVTQESMAHSKDNFFNFNIYDHFWYKDSDSVAIKAPAAIKSHELPHSPLISFPANFIHLIRDGRDVAVSKYFFEKDFCVKNGLIKQFNVSFDDYIKKIAQEWSAYVKAWLQQATPYFKYEDLLEKPQDTLRQILDTLKVDCSIEQIKMAVENNVKNKFSRQLDKAFKHNTFVRKGIKGDWKNHFTVEQQKIFENLAGEMLDYWGYETR